MTSVSLHEPPSFSDVSAYSGIVLPEKAAVDFIPRQSIRRKLLYNFYHIFSYVHNYDFVIHLFYLYSSFKTGIFDVRSIVGHAQSI